MSENEQHQIALFELQEFSSKNTDDSYNAKMMTWVAGQKALGKLPANKSNPFDHAVLMGLEDIDYQEIRERIREQVRSMNEHR